MASFDSNIFYRPLKEVFTTCIHAFFKVYAVSIHTSFELEIVYYTNSNNTEKNHLSTYLILFIGLG